MKLTTQEIDLLMDMIEQLQSQAERCDRLTDRRIAAQRKEVCAQKIDLLQRVLDGE